MAPSPSATKRAGWLCVASASRLQARTALCGPIAPEGRQSARPQFMPGRRRAHTMASWAAENKNINKTERANWRRTCRLARAPARQKGSSLQVHGTHSSGRLAGGLAHSPLATRPSLACQSMGQTNLFSRRGERKLLHSAAHARTSAGSPQRKLSSRRPAGQNSRVKRGERASERAGH